MKSLYTTAYYFLLLVALIAGVFPVLGATYTVNSLADPGTGSGASGSLRYCITQANANPGPHTIVFTGLPSGSIITLSTDLPVISRADVIIDATTVSGYSANQAGIHLDATGLTYGFDVDEAPRFKIYGFEIYGAASGVIIEGDNSDGFVIGAVNNRNIINRCTDWQIEISGADNGVIQNNYVGCNVNATAGDASTASGIKLVTNANGNTIGGTNAGEGNIIAGGTGAAVYIGDYFGAPADGSSNNIFYGNTFGGVGTDMAWWSWIFWIDGNSDNNIIGGVSAGQGNTMTYGTTGFSANGYGNLVVGINDVNADGNKVRGNNMRAAFGNGIVLAASGNNGQAAPTIVGQSGNVLSGTATPNAIVDLYVGTLENSVYGNCKGGEFIATTSADGTGNWSINLSSNLLFNDSMVVATATDAINGTSEFSECFGPLSIGAGASPTCNSGGNVVIFSNYDGGYLNINVDQNIPNLKVGITTYEKTKITFSGAYVGNITEVIYAGFNGQNNHCSPSPPTISIAGVPANITTIYTSNNLEQATIQNPNGWPEIICNYSCDSSNSQGGCNTPDQIVAYYLSKFGGSLYSHFTQYNCWSGTYKISDGGNCCIGADSVTSCTVPLAPGAIVGDTSVCQGQMDVNYSVPAISGANYYLWTVPAGATITSGDSTSAVTINFSGNSISGSVAVKGANNCGNGPISTLSVVVHSLPVSPPIVITDSLICSGDSTKLCVDGAFTSYNWNTTDTSSCIQVSAAGGYWLSVIDANGCANISGRINVSVNPVPSVSITVRGDTLSSFNAESYQWLRDGTEISGANGPVYIADGPGSYSLEITDANGCKAVSAPILITDLFSVGAESLRIFPNPSFGSQIQIEIPEVFLGSQLEIYDAKGRLVFKTLLETLNGQFYMPLGSGVYFLHVNSDRINLVRKWIRL